MSEVRVPDRLRAAVEMLDIEGNDELLEIGCGPGVAVALICDRLRSGHITAIDRSAAAIRRATERNAGHVASGRASFRQVELADLDEPAVPVGKVFAVNVNLFWVRAAHAELEVIRRWLRTGGMLSLFYETPSADKTARVAETVATALREHGFWAVSTESSSAVLRISGGLP